MKRIFNILLGLAICAFGAGLGFLFLKDVVWTNVTLDRKLAVSIVIPLAIIAVGVQRMCKKK